MIQCSTIFHVRNENEVSLLVLLRDGDTVPKDLVDA